MAKKKEAGRLLFCITQDVFLLAVTIGLIPHLPYQPSPEIVLGLEKQ
jgi:hypothetical protein